MEATRQGVEQKAADELVGIERHDLLPIEAFAAVVLVAEGDAGLVEADEAAVRDGDPVGVAGEIGEHRLGAGERRLGVDDPALLPNRFQLAQQSPPIDEVGDESRRLLRSFRGVKEFDYFPPEWLESGMRPRNRPNDHAPGGISCKAGLLSKHISAIIVIKLNADGLDVTVHRRGGAIELPAKRLAVVVAGEFSGKRPPSGRNMATCSALNSRRWE